MDERKWNPILNIGEKKINVKKSVYGFYKNIPDRKYVFGSRIRAD